MTQEYFVVGGESPEQLAEQVNQHIAQGAQPQGGISALRFENLPFGKGISEPEWSFFQAMIRKV